MATTKSIVSDDTVWVTTYSGGNGKGVCFDISMELPGGETQITMTFTRDQLLDTLTRAGGRVRGLVRPDFDRRRPEPSETTIIPGTRLPEHGHVIGENGSMSISLHLTRPHTHDVDPTKDTSYTTCGHYHDIIRDGNGHVVGLGKPYPSGSPFLVEVPEHTHDRIDLLSPHESLMTSLWTAPDGTVHQHGYRRGERYTRPYLGHRHPVTPGGLVGMSEPFNDEV